MYFLDLKESENSREGENMRSRVLFLLAILMGIITTAIFFYTTQMDQKSDDNMTETPMVDVVVAAHAIEAHKILSKEDVKMKKIPEDELHPSMVQSVDNVVGKFTTDFVEQGEFIYHHRMKSTLEESILVSRKIDDGYRGVSIGVDIVRSVSNLIEPEDYVDVIFSYEAEVPELDREEIVSVLLFENVRVLAVGRKLVRNPNGEDYVEYSSITLQLEPDDVVELVNASETGTIHLAVRPSISETSEEDS